MKSGFSAFAGGRLWFVTIVIAIAIYMSGASASAVAQGRAASVVVDTVKKVEISDTRPVIGRLVASVRADLATRTAGIVIEVGFEVGDTITAGQTLVRLDTTLARIDRRAAIAARDVAKAGVDVAEAKLKLAEQTFERQNRLRSSTAFSRSRFDDLRQAMRQAQTERDQAKAAVESAAVQIARADYVLKHAEIKAPFDGIIVERSAQPGQYLQIGNAIATLLDISKLEIEADVPTSLVGGLKRGQTIKARFDDDVRFDARVRAIIPIDNLSTRTRSVRFTLDADNISVAELAAGNTVTIDVPASRRRTVLGVPKDALVQTSKGWMVFVAQDGKAQPRPIEVGQSVGDRVEVVTGLANGDLVVVRGNERLQPGQAIKTQQVRTNGT